MNTSAGPTLLDGGLASQLEAMGHDLSDSLWSARLLRDSPAAIVGAHRAFFEAGAQVAITASYQASYPGFVRAGIDLEEATALMRRSVHLARAAGGEIAGRMVAASIGPYGATLADGSEYRGNYGLSASALREFHAPRMETLLGAGPDLFAIETIPDVREAEVLIGLLAEFDTRAWLSYTVANGQTRAGQSLEEAYAVTAGIDHLVATGVNCCAPEEVPHALRTARRVSSLPGVAYPNSGEGWNAQARTWTGTSGFDAGQARAWVDQGAAWIGGCCRVLPSDIARLIGALSL